MRLLLAAVGTVVVAATLTGGSGRAARRVTDPVGRQLVTLGRSVEGRAIYAVETGDLDSSRKALVVGCIHGNECAGITVADQLAGAPPLRNVDLWVLPDLNPDGAAAGTRGNAHGVDLNRNFPWRWRKLSGVYNSGRAPLSERETRIAYRLIAQVRPSVSIWFHQHLDLVDESSGSKAIERRFAAVAGLQLGSLPHKPGSAVTWESNCFPHATALVVELPAGPVAGRARTRLADATRAAAAAGSARRPAAAAGC